MKKNIQLLLLSQIICFCSKAQLELITPATIYLKDNSRSVGEVKYSPKSNTIKLNTGMKSIEISVSKVDSIVTSNNESFTIKQFGNQYVIYQKMVSGNVSLLYQKGEKKYYIERQDSLILLPQKNLRGTLIFLFPKFSSTKRLSEEQNMVVKYSNEFLSNFVNSFNKEIYPNSKSQILENHSNRQYLYLSPYLGYQLTRTKIKSDIQNTNSNLYATPVFGVSVIYKRPYKNLYLELDIFKNSFSIKENNIGRTARLRDLSGLIIQVFNPTIVSFNSENIFVDTKLVYDFKRRVLQKTVPYISFGPSFGIPVRPEAIFGSIYYDNPSQREYPLYDRYQNFTNYYYLGCNGSIGLKHSFTDKLQLKLGVKAQSTFIKLVPRFGSSISQNPISIEGRPYRIPYISYTYSFFTTNQSIFGELGLYYKF
ncbi:MAG: hypothetical protein MUF45_04140 [Spirosomaceae bacterium]|jgi:hypothetical protein|nr:hypothetical protein [Spirosomataceae bacterium]